MELSFPYCPPTTPALHSPFLPPPPFRKPHRPIVSMSAPAMTLPHHNPDRLHRKEKLLVILGATGAGKSRLSIDLATRFPSSEIINSDKIQVYSGLDITTNKIPVPDRRGIPHHLLGCFCNDHVDFTPSMFRSAASSIVSAVHSRRGLPILVGGSNSFVQALVSSASRLDQEEELRYDCCFLWVDVSWAVLEEYLDRRVEEMLKQGMVEELREYYEKGRRRRRDYSRGLRRAIGVEEFDRYFDKCGEEEYERAVREIKENTRRLAKKQVGKIVRMREVGGWDLRRFDAWERDVLLASVNIVTSFSHLLPPPPPTTRQWLSFLCFLVLFIFRNRTFSGREN